MSSSDLAPARPAWLARGMVSYRVMAIALCGTAAFLPAPSARGQQGQPLAVPPVSVEGDAPAERGGDAYKVERSSSLKHTEPLRDTPQTITVIPRTLIEERAASTMTEALRGVPGISLVAGEGGGPQGDNLKIRGFAANTDIYVDGMRDLSQYNRDPFAFEGIEVSKGPASAYTGRGSTGGSINLISKSPRRERFYDGIATLGTDDTKRLTADINQPFGALGLEGAGTAAFRLNAMVHEADVAERDVTEYFRYGVAPSLAVGLGTPTRGTVSLFYLSEDNIPDYGLPLTSGKLLQPLDRTNFYGFSKLNTEEVTAEMMTFQLEHDFNDTFTVREQLRREYTTRFSIVTPPRNANPLTDTVTINPTGRDGDNELLISQTDLVSKFTTGPVNHTLVSGVELSRERAENQRITFTGPFTTSLFNPNPDAPFTGGPGVRAAKTDATGDTVAVYAFDTLKLGEQWQLIGGARWDHFKANVETVGVEELERTDTMWSTRAALVYKPVPYASIYAGYATSFNPSAEALALSTSATSNANVTLEPEENRSYEIGTKWDLFDQRLALTAAVFRTEKTNARTDDASDPNDVNVTEGVQRVDGFEIGVAGSITPAWKVFGGYTYMNSEIVESRDPNEVGNQVGNTPKHTFTLWSTYEMPWNVQVGGGLQYVSDRTVSDSNPGRVDGYVRFDGLVAYHLTETVDLRLNLYNITNEFYFERVHGGGSHGVPGAGRTALLSAAIRL